MDKKVTAIAKKYNKNGSNQTFEYEAGDWKIIAIDGVDAPTIELFKTARGIGDGDLLTGTRLHSRLITIKASLTDTSSYVAQRKAITSFHDVRAKYRLEITYLDRTVETDFCAIEAISYPTSNVYDNPDFVVGFFVPDPGFYSPDEKKLNFAETIGMWHVERAYTESNPSLPFSYTKPINNIILNYLGTDAAGIRLEITLSEQSNNLVVKINNAYYTILKRPTYPLNVGDRIIIDSFNRNITYNGRSLSLAELRKTPISKLILEPGDNSIAVLKDTNDSPLNASVELSYRERFLSI